VQYIGSNILRNIFNILKDFEGRLKFLAWRRHCASGWLTVRPHGWESLATTPRRVIHQRKRGYTCLPRIGTGCARILAVISVFDHWMDRF